MIKIGYPMHSFEVACKKLLDLAFNNVKPKDWYFVLDLVRFRTELGYERIIRS